MLPLDTRCLFRRATGLLALVLLMLLPGVPAAAQISFAPLAGQPPDNIYSIVTEPGTGTLYACNGLQVISSTNQGASWTKLANSGGFNLKCLYMTAAGQLYAGAEKASAPPTATGVFKYNKAANTWGPMAGSPVNVSALLEDPLNGFLYAGTGTTNNIVPNPINLGLGGYVFNGTAWATANTGMPNVPGYSVLPYIKGLSRLSTGEMVAATYGNGVLKYSGGTWTTHGSALPNLNVNCLEAGTGATFYAGTDNGVFASTGGAWAAVQPGLPAGKPVRALLNTGGLLYAGLGYFHYQQGGLVGDIYTTTGAAAWTNAGAGFASTTVLALQAIGTTVLAAACGIWARPAGGSWAYSQAGVVLANRPYIVAHNSQGHLFAMCNNSIGIGSYSGTSFGYGGLFRSTDGGATWTSINQGITRQGLTALFVDSQDQLWVGGHQFQGNSANPAWTAPALYKSIDNGATWVQNNSINVSQDGHEFIDEDHNGRLYVSHAFGSPSNMSATNDYAAFDNSLLPNPASVNGKTYGFALNASNHVFVGTEIGGLFRSTANGAPGTFTNIVKGVANCPEGNIGVTVDEFTGTLFTVGIHGRVNGVSNVAQHNFCSLPADNGTNLFPFNNLPAYGNLKAIYCDNQGKFYGYYGGFVATESGLYTASAPFTSSTVFTRLTISAQSTVSYQFNSFMADACGYLYATNVSGAGIYRSALPVNTPPASAPSAPAAGASGVPVTPSFAWATACATDTYQLQIATDAAFGSVVYNISSIAASPFSPPGGTLQANTGYFWRLRNTNAAGTGVWSAARSFTTAAPLPVTLVSFSAGRGGAAQRVELRWRTASELNAAYFAVERSFDGRAFQAIGTVPAAGGATAPHRYRSTDDLPGPGPAYYRLRQMDRDGGQAFSPVVAVAAAPASACLSVFETPGEEVLGVAAPCAHPAYAVRVLSSLGATVAGFGLAADAPAATCSTAALPNGLYLVQVWGDRGELLATYKKIKSR